MIYSLTGKAEMLNENTIIDENYINDRKNSVEERKPPVQAVFNL